MKCLNVAGSTNAVPTAKETNFGSYRVYKNSPGTAVIRAIHEIRDKKLVDLPQTAYASLVGKEMAVVTWNDMSFLKQLNTAAERNAYLAFLTNPENAPLITKKDVSEMNFTELKAKMVITKERFELFLNKFRRGQ